jgi:diguanylate cyclase (GGDEF)-like protein
MEMGKLRPHAAISSNGSTTPGARISWIVGQPTPALIAEALVLTLVVGFLDAVTGAELSFSIFYLLPITLLASALGLRWALANAVVASTTWLIADDLAGQDYSHGLYPFWNAFMRLGYFVLFAVLFSRLHRALDQERTLARTDPLTSLFNRRAFVELAGREVERARRYERPLTLAYMDLDHFKAVNDEHGHDVGDQLLRQVASTLITSMRATDVVARLGGDEFAILLSETDRERAVRALDKARRALDEHMSAHGWGVTFSIGVACAVSPADTLADLLATADRLSYEAKRAGRDRIAVDSREPTLPTAELSQA